ncbi:MAG TPA: TIR domain-containing protein [Gemmatimonadaceae bacterium]|nr:TIR domain-containing protein [Gemmatimonadaceae bacterium]
MSDYDVFISYRRDGGAAEARLLQSKLNERKIRTFLDVTELGRGYFDDALLKHIEQTPNFLVILSPQSLSRGEHVEDWLRREIAHALATERNVVPLMMPGFTWPAKLPKDLRDLRRHQGLDYSHLYFDAMLQKLVATLDLPAAPAAQQQQQRQQQERPSQDQLEKSRVERALLEEERQKLEKARASSERLRQETELRRRSLEMRQAEDARRRGEENQKNKDSPGRWSDRVLLGDLSASPAVRQASIVAFWLVLLVALALFGAAGSGNSAQAGFTFGGIFLALAVWVRLNPMQASTTGLVVCGLLAIFLTAGVLNQQINATAIWFALLAGTATAAFWRVSRAARSAARDAMPAEEKAAAPESPRPFGQRFGELIGAAGGPIDFGRWRLFAGARVVAGLALAFSVGSHPVFFNQSRPAWFDIVWVSVALPLALMLTFRWLRYPLLALVAAAVLESLVNPLFWRGQSATLVVAQELAGTLLFAWAIEEIENTNLAVWCGSAAATLMGGVLYRLAGYRAATLFAGASPGEVMLLPFVFTAVFVAATFYIRRPKPAAT